MPAVPIAVCRHRWRRRRHWRGRIGKDEIVGKGTLRATTLVHAYALVKFALQSTVKNSHKPWTFSPMRIESTAVEVLMTHLVGRGRIMLLGLDR